VTSRFPRRARRSGGGWGRQARQARNCE
jgi:hypothetical protein